MEEIDDSEHMKYFKLSRKWLPDIEVDRDNEKTIRVMSYNVLADSYLSHVDYKDTDPEILSWQYRHKLIIE